jgi:hypothetical protein
VDVRGEDYEVVGIVTLFVGMPVDPRSPKKEIFGAKVFGIRARSQVRRVKSGA